MASAYQREWQKLTSAERIQYPSNDGIFKDKTVRNILVDVWKRGLLRSDRHDGEVLTLFGRKELERLNAGIDFA